MVPDFVCGIVVCDCCVVFQEFDEQKDQDKAWDWPCIMIMMSSKPRAWSNRPLALGHLDS